MKNLFKLITLLTLTITLNMNAQWSYPGGNWAMHAQNSTATGEYAAAMGNGTTASGNYSTSMGDNTTASGSASTSMGWWSTASGSASTAMGRYTIASDYGSLVIGKHNSSGSTVTNSATVFNTANTAFVIGNGADELNKSDAFKVMFSGDTYVSGSLYIGGTAITSTSGELNILDGVTANASELNLLDGVSIIGDGILASVTENGSSGVRLSNSNASNHGDIGSNAVDLSYQANSSLTRGATGRYSTAAGEATTASGESSTALGYYSVASGGYGAIAMGNQTTASGANSTVMGEGGTASGSASTAMGRGTTASDYASVVIGQYNSSGSSATNATSYSTSNTAFVIGNGVDSSNKSDAFKVMFNGNTTISGDDLTIGNLSAFSGSFTQRSAIDVVAHSDGDLMTGYLSGSTGDRFNIELDSSNSLSKISSSGGYNMTLYSEGGTMNFESGGMGTATFNFTGDLNVSNDLTISGDVVISSDARLKSNIVSLGSTLSRLLLIDGKSYYMKGKQKIGVLAQEIKEVFPELVTEDENENLAVNYQGLVPVLINALKEQESKVQEQEERIKRLEKLLLD